MTTTTLTPAMPGCAECSGQGRIMLLAALTDACSLCGGNAPAGLAPVQRINEPYLRALIDVSKLDRTGHWDVNLLNSGDHALRTWVPKYEVDGIDLWGTWRRLGGASDAALTFDIILDLQGAYLDVGKARAREDMDPSALLVINAANNSRMGLTWQEWYDGAAEAIVAGHAVSLQKPLRLRVSSRRPGAQAALGLLDTARAGLGGVELLLLVEN